MTNMTEMLRSMDDGTEELKSNNSEPDIVEQFADSIEGSTQGVEDMEEPEANNPEDTTEETLDDLALISLSEEDYEALDGLTELTTLPDKTEVVIEIEDIQTHGVNNKLTMLKMDKNKRPYFIMRAKIIEVIGADIDVFTLKKVNHMMYVPLAAYYPGAQNAEALNKKRRSWKIFHEALGMSMSKELSLLDFVGKQATVILKLEPDEQYGDKNVIMRFVTTK